MDKHNFKEKLIHGTPAFPIAVYNNTFDKQYNLLAPLHYHNEFELLVATKGSLSVQIEENIYELSEGDGIFINSGLLHIINSTDDQNHGFIAIVFDYSLICNNHDITFTKYIQPLYTNTIVPNNKLSTEICNKIKLINAAYEDAHFGFELFIKHCVTEILHSLIKDSIHTTLPIQNTKSLIIKNVLDYIEQNYAEDISLQDMADYVHISKEYLCRVFNSMSDNTPIEYLNRYRIRQSTIAITHTDKTISDIALSCGFNNSSYFNKIFLRYMNCTPTEYRKNNTHIIK